MADDMFKFKSKVNEFGDVLRNYLWKVQFLELPKAVKVVALNANANASTTKAMDADSLTFLARECVIPGVSMSSVIESSFLNWKRRYPAKFEFNGEISITFEEYESLRANSVLYAWKEAIQNSESGVSTASTTGNEKADLVTDVRVYLYSFNGTKTKKCILIRNVFIKDIQEVSLSYDSSEGVKLSCSFSYDYWSWEDAP